MRKRGSGSLLFLSSLAVYMSMPGASCYSGSKALLEGIVSNLAIEIAPFGLRTCLVTPGYLRTSLMGIENLSIGNAPQPLPDYEQMNKHIQLGCAAADGTQQGDPKKAAEVVVDAVRGEGKCEGKELPARLLLGPDAIEGVRAHCASTLKTCDEWAEIAGSTNIDSSN
jgi:NAD(P)-dependent dehydrogenase (short-subunit alcohol dehydrogenase family)